MKLYLRGSSEDKKWKNKILNKLDVQESEREDSDYYLYIITPKLVDIFLISDLIDDSYDFPEKTIYCVFQKDYINSKSKTEIQFSEKQMKMLDAIGEIIERNGGKYFKNLDEIVNYLNKN